MRGLLLLESVEGCLQLLHEAGVPDVIGGAGSGIVEQKDGGPEFVGAMAAGRAFGEMAFDPGLLNGRQIVFDPGGEYLQNLAAVTVIVGVVRPVSLGTIGIAHRTTSSR